MPKLEIAACECEHACHFIEEQPSNQATVRFLSPNGNPGHEYAVEFSKAKLVTVATVYGHFDVCPDCAKDCMQHGTVVDCKAYEG